MSATLDRIIEEVRALAPEEKRRLREALDAEANAGAPTERDKLAIQIRGKYADLLSSSEDFARRKAVEITMEDRR